MTQLLCVPPDRAAEFIMLADRFIEAAINRVGMDDPAGVHYDVLTGDALLWLAVDGQTVIGAGVTRLVMSRGKKICLIVAWGADDQARCAPLLATVERFARDEGCAAVRLIGRKGWARVLPTYRIKATTYEKAL